MVYLLRRVSVIRSLHDDMSAVGSIGDSTTVTNGLDRAALLGPVN